MQHFLLHVKHLIDMAPRQLWADDFVEGVETWQGGPTLFVQHYATSVPMTFKGDGGSIMPIACAMLSEPTRALRMGYDFARGAANVEEPVLLAVSPTIGDPSHTIANSTIRRNEILDNYNISNPTSTHAQGIFVSNSTRNLCAP